MEIGVIRYELERKVNEIMEIGVIRQGLNSAEIHGSFLKHSILPLLLVLHHFLREEQHLKASLHFICLSQIFLYFRFLLHLATGTFFHTAVPIHPHHLTILGQTKRQFMHWKHTSSPVQKKTKIISPAGKAIASLVFFFQMQKALYLQTIFKRANYERLSWSNTHETWQKGFCFIRVMLQHISPQFQCLLCMTVALNHLILFPTLLGPPHLTVICPPTCNKTLVGKQYCSGDGILFAVDDFLQDQSIFTNGIQTLKH